MMSMFNQLADMSFIELIALILGCFVVFPRIYYFFEVMQISFFMHQKDFLKRYYNYEGETYAVVIGGTSGIGKQLAIRLGHMGFSIVLIGKNKDKMEDTKQRILAQAKVEVKLIIADLSNNSTDLYTDKIYPQLKELDIAIFVNNCYDCARGYFKDIPIERLYK